jgi:hypothetical protein
MKHTQAENSMFNQVDLNEKTTPELLSANKSRGSMFVVTCISNVARYKRRPELYQRFKEMCYHAGVNLITVEIALGERDFEVTNRGNPMHLQLRTQCEFFHKEAGLNLGIQYGRLIFPQATEVCWIDADCFPARPPREWFLETWHALQVYQFVQMWEWLQPLDSYNNPLTTPNPSFMSNYVKYGTPYPKKQNGYPQSWGSPGLAWAANLSALDHIGGIPDVAILGAGDWYLAHMLTSGLELKGMEEYTDGYRNYWLRKQELCERHIRRDVGYVPGLVLHEFHGHTVNRRYNTRERILIDNQYDPNADLKRGVNGLYQLETYEPRQVKMYDQIRSYFRQRNEDQLSH